MKKSVADGKIATSMHMFFICQVATVLCCNDKNGLLTFFPFICYWHKLSPFSLFDPIRYLFYFVDKIYAIYCMCVVKSIVHQQMWQMER